MPLILKTIQKRAYDLLSDVLETGYAEGVEFPAATAITTAIDGWEQLKSILGVDYRAVTKNFVKVAIAAIYQTIEPWRIVNTPGQPPLLGAAIDIGGDPSDEFNRVGFYQDPFGIVRLQGFIKPNTEMSGGSLFVLPEEYRPAGREVRFVPGFITAGYLQIRVDIGPDGVVGIYTPIDLEGYITLDGISFRAA